MDVFGFMQGSVQVPGQIGKQLEVLPRNDGYLMPFLITFRLPWIVQQVSSTKVLVNSRRCLRV